MRKDRDAAGDRSDEFAADLSNTVADLTDFARGLDVVLKDLQRMLHDTGWEWPDIAPTLQGFVRKLSFVYTLRQTIRAFGLEAYENEILANEIVKQFPAPSQAPKPAGPVKQNEAAFNKYLERLTQMEGGF